MVLVIGLFWLALRFLLPSTSAVESVTGSRRLAWPPVRSLVNVKLEEEGKVLRAAGPGASFVVAAGSGRAVQGLRLRLRPLNFFAAGDFLAAQVRPGSDDRQVELNLERFRVSRGVSRVENGVVEVRWRLATPAERYRVVLPDRAVFRLEVLEVMEGPTSAGRGPVETLAAAGAVTTALALLLAGVAVVQGFWPQGRLSGTTVRTLLLAGVAVAAALTLFLVPPFQGPDEPLHWRTALAMYRPCAEGEPALYNMPDTMDPEDRVRYHSENAFNPQRFHAPVTPDESGVPKVLVNYSNPLTYPEVAAAGLLFPRVATARDALTFYYLCRLLPVAALLALLWWANRSGILGYTALVLFSSPLLLQQVGVVSSDTVPLLGSLLAAVLFAARWRKEDGRLTTALTATCFVAFLAKPPAYIGLLLLPLVFAPWRRLPRRAFVTVGLIAFGATALALTRVPPQYAGVLLLTEDTGVFLSRCWGWFGRHRWPEDLYQLLGWVDTYFNPRHQALVRLSVWVAVPLDLAAFGPALLRTVRERPVQALATAAAAVAALLSMFLGFSLLMYVTLTRPDAPVLIGVQPRYFFPGLILVAVLPPALARGAEGESQAAARWCWADGLAVAVLPLLFISRMVELAVDLQYRYW